ncbi:hypothetical protein PLANTIT3_60275 [Plantibacter sp. T3]|nr:hypothetical protein PLANTIT3_60275 [Plantibacter sp. T3]
MRGDRRDAVGLAPVPRDRVGRRPRHRRDRPLQRVRRRPLRGRHGLLLRQPAAASPRPPAAVGGGGGRRTPQTGLVRLPVLPAEHRALDRGAAGSPRDVDPRRCRSRPPHRGVDRDRAALLHRRHRVSVGRSGHRDGGRRRRRRGRARDPHPRVGRGRLHPRGWIGRAARTRRRMGPCPALVACGRHRGARPPDARPGARRAPLRGRPPRLDRLRPRTDRLLRRAAGHDGGPRSPAVLRSRRGSRGRRAPSDPGPGGDRRRRAPRPGDRRRPRSGRALPDPVRGARRRARHGTARRGRDDGLGDTDHRDPHPLRPLGQPRTGCHARLVPLPLTSSRPPTPLHPLHPRATRPIDTKAERHEATILHPRPRGGGRPPPRGVYLRGFRLRR